MGRGCAVHKVITAGPQCLLRTVVQLQQITQTLRCLQALAIRMQSRQAVESIRIREARLRLTAHPVLPTTPFAWRRTAICAGRWWRICDVSHPAFLTRTRNAVAVACSTSGILAVSSVAAVATPTLLDQHGESLRGDLYHDHPQRKFIVEPEVQAMLW